MSSQEIDGLNVIRESIEKGGAKSGWSVVGMYIPNDKLRIAIENAIGCEWAALYSKVNFCQGFLSSNGGRIMRGDADHFENGVDIITEKVSRLELEEPQIEDLLQVFYNCKPI